MTLSILIAASRENKKNLDYLVTLISAQMPPELRGQIEVFIEARDNTPIGWKCNELLKDAAGKYIWFLKDTDVISETAIADILRATENDPDIIGYNGSNIYNETIKDFRVSLPEFSWRSPMKRSLVEPFANKKVQAVKLWKRNMSEPIHPFKKEYFLAKPLIRTTGEVLGDN